MRAFAIIARKTPARVAAQPGLTSQWSAGSMTNLIKSAPHRNRLAQRRLAETFEIEVSGLRYTATVGRLPDGRVAEVFLQNHKPGSQSDANATEGSS